MIILKQFNSDEHYEILTDWWKKQDWTPVPIDGLSKTGLVAYNEDEPLAAAFLYDTDSAWALLEWIVGNPDSEKKIKREAIGKIIDGLVVFAQLKNKKYIHTVTRHKGLLKIYEDHGFEGQTKVTELVRSL